jgi:hypothetical protein
MRSVKMVVAVAVVGVVVGAAGTAFAKPLTESQWKKQGNAICRQINNEINDIGNEAFAELGPDEEPSAAQLTAYVEQLLPAIETGLVSINKLQEPKSVRKGLTRFNREVTGVLVALDDDPTILLGNEDPFEDAGKAAKAVGLKACAN